MFPLGSLPTTLALPNRLVYTWIWFIHVIRVTRAKSLLHESARRGGSGELLSSIRKSLMYLKPRLCTTLLYAESWMLRGLVVESVVGWVYTCVHFGCPLWLKGSCRLRSALVEQRVRTGLEIQIYSECVRLQVQGSRRARRIILKISDDMSLWNVLGLWGPIASVNIVTWRLPAPR